MEPVPGTETIFTRNPKLHHGGAVAAAAVLADPTAAPAAVLPDSTAAPAAPSVVEPIDALMADALPMPRLRENADFFTAALGFKLTLDQGTNEFYSMR